MTAIRRVIQHQLFECDDERIRAIVNVSKLNGKKKKRQLYLCLTVTIEHPIAVRLYFVKEEKEDVFRKKERFHLREIREIDGINPKKPSRRFDLTVSDGKLEILAGNSDEKEEFIRELYKLASQYSPLQMPEFFNMPIPSVETAEITFVRVQSPDQNENIDGKVEDYQPISDREDADFRKLMERAGLRMDEVDKFAEILTEQLQSLEGDNIAAMMESEVSVNQLLAEIESALKRADLVERELDACDGILSVVRDSIELIEEKDSLSVVERRNQKTLCRELTEFVNEMDMLTDAHVAALRRANFGDLASIKRCEEAARAVSDFWNGELSKQPLREMKAFQKRDEESVEVVDVFADRLLSHLSALFTNLNDLSLDQEWHDLCIPKQSQRFRALFPLAKLIGWLKTNRPKAFSLVLQKYVASTNQLYKRLFDAFFETLIVKIPKARAAERKRSESHNLTIRSSDNLSFASISSDLQLDGDLIPQLIETVLGELSTVMCGEQKFLVRFFHLNSELPPSETASFASADCSLLLGVSRNFESDHLRHVMSGLFESLNSHLDVFCRAVCRENPTNVLRLFVLISRKVLVPPQDAGSYCSVLFGGLVVLIKRQFDAFINLECSNYSDVRIAKKTRPGIVPSIDRFARFVRLAEQTFKSAERRTDIEKAYSLMCRSVFDGIEKAAGASYKTPALVVKFENYHQLYLTLSELRVTCLDPYRKEAKSLKKTCIDEYVKEAMGRPLREIHVFFEHVTDALESRVLREHTVSYEPQFSRTELRRAISMHPAREVKKELEQLYRNTEKQLVEGSSLLQVVWRHMQDQFMRQIVEYNSLIVRCYPGSRIELTVSADDVLRFFSQIAQQH